MKTQIASILAFSLASSLVPAAVAAEPTDPKLAQLVGRWEGKTSFTLRGETTTWSMSMTCERAAIGPGIACTVLGVSGDRRYEEAHLIGHDRASGTYHLFSVNSWGEAYDHVATWKDTARVSFVHAGTRDGKALRETYAYEWKGGKLLVNAALTVGGKTIGESSGRMERVP